MADVRKVISPLNTTTLSSVTNFCQTPEGDRPVFLNKVGLLETNYPPVQGACKSNQAITTAALSASNTFTHFVGGTFYSTTNALFPSNDLTPYRRLINASGAPGGAFTLTFPTPNAHLIYLKNLLGPENVVPGLKWEVDFMNSTAQDMNLTIQVPGAGFGTVTCIGWQGAGPFTVEIQAVANANRIQTCSGRVMFMIGSTTPGAENIIYWFTAY